MVKRIIPISLLALYSSLHAQAQTLQPLSPTSRFVCVSSGDASSIGQLTASGYRLVATSRARRTLVANRTRLQQSIRSLRRVRRSVSGGDQPNTETFQQAIRFIRSIGTGQRQLRGDRDDKLAILDSNITIASGLLALANQELQALSNCVQNRPSTTPMGNYAPQIFIARDAAGNPFEIIVALIADDRDSIAGGGVCIKDGTLPAQPGGATEFYKFTADPCEFGSCAGIFGSHKVGVRVYYAYLGHQATEQDLNAQLGPITEKFDGHSYQVRPKLKFDKPCSQIFGEN